MKFTEPEKLIKYLRHSEKADLMLYLLNQRLFSMKRITVLVTLQAHQFKDWLTKCSGGRFFFCTTHFFHSYAAK